MVPMLTALPARNAGLQIGTAGRRLEKGERPNNSASASGRESVRATGRFSAASQPTRVVGVSSRISSDSEAETAGLVC